MYETHRGLAPPEPVPPEAHRLVTVIDAALEQQILYVGAAPTLEVQDFDLAGTPLPLTQDQIADATGLTPVHVNRMLKSLRAEGCIERLGGGMVVVSDLAGLQRVGGFDARYLHLTRSPANCRTAWLLEHDIDKPARSRSRADNREHCVEITSRLSART